MPVHAARTETMGTHSLTKQRPLSVAAETGWGGQGGNRPPHFRSKGGIAPHFLSSVTSHTDCIQTNEALYTDKTSLRTCIRVGRNTSAQLLATRFALREEPDSGRILAFLATVSRGYLCVNRIGCVLHA